MSNDSLSLSDYGWNDDLNRQFRDQARAGYQPGRVILEYNQFSRVFTKHGEILAETAGKLRHGAASRAELPAVGDWVALRMVAGEKKATIHAVLPRKSKFTRKVAGGKTDEQVVGANIDTVFLVAALNQDFNLRRLERYLTIALESGAQPVIILSKADLCADAASRFEAVQSIAEGIPTQVISVFDRPSIAALNSYFTPGQTVALIGSSGAGKSTLINLLVGEERQKVKDIRAHDERGQHTTRHRELIRLPQGALVMDTPGMREIQLWDADEGVQAAFDDIEELARQCRFSDCRHQREPGCAVAAAVESGELEAGRQQNYLKLQHELQQLTLKQDKRAQMVEKQRLKKLSHDASIKARAKRRGGD